MLLLQIRNRGGIVRRPFARVREGRLFIAEDLNVSEVMSVGQTWCVEDQCPAIATRGRRRPFNAERARTRGLRTNKGGGTAAGSRRELDPCLPCGHRLEVVESGEVNGKKRAMRRHERRVFHVQLGAIRPMGHVERRRFGRLRFRASLATGHANGSREKCGNRRSVLRSHY